MVQFDGYDTVQWVHVLAAAVVIGVLAMLPFVRLVASRIEDVAVVQYTTHLLHAVLLRLVAPALVVVFATGLLMIAGPLARWDALHVGGRWALVGLALWVVLSAVVGFVLGLLRQMSLLAEHDHAGTEEMRKRWREYRVSVAVAISLVVVIEWVMVARPVLFA